MDGRGINRIRLEFKGHSSSSASVLSKVLIESDWNLKRITTPFRVGLFLY